MSSYLLKPLFNHQLVYYITKRKQNLIDYADRMHFFVFSIFFIRTILIGLSVQFDIPEYIQLDHSAGILAENTNFHGIFFYIFSINVWFPMMTQLLLLYKSDYTLWEERIYQLVNVNWDHFVTKYDQVQTVFLKDNQNKMQLLYWSFVHKIRLIVFFSKGKNIIFDEPLSNFPYLMSVVRSKVLLTLMYLDIISKLFLLNSGNHFQFLNKRISFVCLSVMSFLSLLVLYTYLDLTSYAINYWQLVYLIDRITTFMAILYYLTMCQFIMCSGNIIKTASRNLYKTLDRLLHNLSHKGRLSQLFLSNALKYFRSEHYNMTKFIMHANESFYSDFILTFLGCNLPCNVYLLSYLLTQQLTILSVLFCYITLLTQIVNGIFFILPLLIANKKISISAKHFVRLQARMTQTTLSCKLHHLSYFEIIHSNQKLGFTAGTSHVITRQLILQVKTLCSLDFPIL